MGNYGKGENPRPGMVVSLSILTRRELDILCFMSHGYTNKDAAQHLHIANSTVSNHLQSIYRKLNANNGTHAVAMALRARWIR